MNDLRLWFVFMGVGMATIVVLNPTHPMLIAGPATVLPVTTTALIAMLVSTVLDGIGLRRKRRLAMAGVATSVGNGPSTVWLNLCFAFAMAMQAIVILSTGTADLPPWAAPWAFLALTLATELALLLLYEKAVGTLKQGTPSGK